MTEEGPNDMTEDERKALEFAELKHRGQLYGDRPYMHHIYQVHAVSCEFNGRRAARVAAILHDTVEDTDATVSDIASEFGDRIAHIVEAVTDRPGRNRKERQERTYPLTQEAGLDAVFVKLCDRIANVRACLSEKKKGLYTMYQKEYALFRRFLHTPNDFLVMWDELERLLSLY